MVHTELMAPKRRLIREIMGSLGFSEEGRHFRHPNTKLFVEFPTGPPAVGEEPVKEIHQLRRSTGTLKIISPTDCVKDRLTWFYHDQDQQCFEQAALVVQQNYVDFTEIERWSKGEDKIDVFMQIRERLQTKA